MGDHSVGIQRQELARVVAQTVADTPQGDLQCLPLRHGVGAEQLVDRLIRRDKRKPVGQLEAAVSQAALLPDAGHAQGRLVDHLQAQARGHPPRRLLGPAAQQVPGAQTQVLGNQQPDPHQVARDPVGQMLAHAPLDATRIARFSLRAALVTMGKDLGVLLVGRPDVEFFFPAHSCG